MPTQGNCPDISPRLPEEDEIDLADLLFVLWRKRNIILSTQLSQDLDSLKTVEMTG